MATMNISLPDKMREWIEAQVKTGRYANASDYVRDLVRDDQTNAYDRFQLEQALREGEESEMSELSVLDIWEEVKAEDRH